MNVCVSRDVALYHLIHPIMPMLAVALGLARSVYCSADKLMKAVDGLDLDMKMAIVRRIRLFGPTFRRNADEGAV